MNFSRAAGSKPAIDSSEGARRPDRRAARSVSLEVLNRVERTEAYADLLLASLLNRTHLKTEDRALATEITYGVLRWRGRLDWVLSKASHIPPNEMEVHIRNILRIGVYQLLFLRIPEFAAVHETVELAKKNGPKSKAFVNAVLRKTSREKESIGYPSSWSGRLATFWSHPEWLVRYWRETLGQKDTEELVKVNNQAPPRIIRVNPLRIRLEEFLIGMAERGIRASTTRYAPQAVCLECSPVAEGEGEIWNRQSEASQLISHILDPRPGELILDACAGAGGKTLHIAELMQNQGEIVALDIHSQGMEALKKRARQAKVEIVRPILGDASRDLGSIAERRFDRILVDAPCTGLGTLRSHPDAKWRRTMADVVSMAKLQRQLLENVVPHLRKGGILVYSTCTLTREENEDTITHLLRTAPALTQEGCELFLPAGCGELVDQAGFLRTFPHRHGLDGFFAARFRKDCP